MPICAEGDQVGALQSNTRIGFLKKGMLANRRSKEVIKGGNSRYLPDLYVVYIELQKGSGF